MSKLYSAQMHRFVQGNENNNINLHISEETNISVKVTPILFDSPVSNMSSDAEQSVIKLKTSHRS